MMCAYYLALLKQIKGANADVDSTISHFKELGFSEHAEMLETLRDRLLSSSKQSIA